MDTQIPEQYIQPFDRDAALEVFRHRAGLYRTRRALADGKLTLGFIGGSVTDANGQSWPDPVIVWFQQRFPGVRLTVENAAIGATRSDLAVFRAERDLIDRGCDLVFVEYVVNDNWEPVEKRKRSREGLLRKLLAGEGRDVVLVYTFCQGMYWEISRGMVPASIAEFEELGEHYRLGSVWMGLHALREVQAGIMRWEEWLPDGAHAQARGSLSYARSVTTFLDRELIVDPTPEAIPTGDRRPAPLNPGHWEFARKLPFDVVSFEGPWTIRRCTTSPWFDQVIDTSAVGARLSIPFEGRGLVLGFEYREYAAEFLWRLDGGEWRRANRVNGPGWSSCYISVLADDLPAGRHTLELEVVHGNQPDSEGAFHPEFKGTTLRLLLIGVIP